MTWDLDQLQEEHKPWVAHNFGDRPSWMPLLGLVEETCDELYTAIKKPDVAEIKDAAADIVIFMSDFCTAMGFRLQSLYDAAVRTMEYELQSRSICIGRLAHAYLKKAQGIRGDPAMHDASMRTSLENILRHCLVIAGVNNFDLLETVQATWEQVRKRDFVLYPKTGLPS